jgi:hypothetical protein
VQPVVVAEVTDELYALTPAEFTAARDERARQVRAAGQRDEAAAIKKLSRPTASAWLVNQLTRAAADQMTRLYELGDALQEAQRALAGDRLRELSVERRHLVRDLLPAASDLAHRAGQPASAAVLGEVRATLEAALADADARAAVRSGRLVKALAYAGLGEVDLTAALALAPEPRSVAGPGRAAATDTPASLDTPAADARSAGPLTSSRRPASGRTAGDRAQRAAAAAQAAQLAADEAAESLEQAERQVAGVGEQRQFLRRRISHLERELGETRTADARLAKEAKQAERARDAAARNLEAASRQLDKARRLAGDPG